MLQAQDERTTFLFRLFKQLTNEIKFDNDFNLNLNGPLVLITT